MLTLFAFSPLTAFAMGVALGSAVAWHYRTCLMQTSGLLGAILARPDLYDACRRTTWARLRREEFERDMAAATRRHKGA